MNKMILVISVAALSACGKISVEEYNGRIKYCEDNGYGYVTEQNKSGHIWVSCVKDGYVFESKWENE